MTNRRAARIRTLGAARVSVDATPIREAVAASDPPPPPPPPKPPSTGPSLPHPLLRARSYAPFGIALPWKCLRTDASEGTRFARLGNRACRPAPAPPSTPTPGPFINSPNSSRCLVSTLITGTSVRSSVTRTHHGSAPVPGDAHRAAVVDDDADARDGSHPRRGHDRLIDRFATQAPPAPALKPDRELVLDRLRAPPLTQSPRTASPSAASSTSSSWRGRGHAPSPPAARGEGDSGHPGPRCGGARG